MTEKLTVAIPELAEMLSISKNHCYYLASIDALPVRVIRLGARIVVSRRAVMRLLDGDGLADMDTGKTPGSEKS